MDLLLIHMPKLRNFYNPIGHFMYGNLIASGVFSIADHVQRAGFDVRILHYGIEALSDPAFRLDDYVARAKPRLVSFSLHWHYQTYDVLQAAKLLKTRFPDLPILLGGMTAGLFADDLLRDHPEVDFVIRGDGEVPAADLLSRLIHGGDLDSVPNLSRRAGGGIAHNPISFVADPAFLSAAGFHRYDLLERADRYLGGFNHIMRLLDTPEWMNRKILRPGSVGHVVMTGRGCPVECSYCGGARGVEERTTGRTRAMLRSPDSVIAELREVEKFGVRRLYFPFDPYPQSDYYPGLFKRIRAEGLNFGASFESFGLPGEPFFDAFAEGFGARPENVILLTVETGDEKLRAANRGYAFTNDGLLACLDAMERRALSFHLSFSLGLPGETPESLGATRDLWQKIKSRYRHLAGMQATLINLDPGSLAETHPERYGISTRPRTLAEFESLHRDSHRESLTAWGHLPLHHECPGLIGVEKGAGGRATDLYLRRFKCRHFCPYIERMRIPYPFNRLVCSASGLAFRLVNKLSSDLR